MRYLRAFLFILAALGFVSCEREPSDDALPAGRAVELTINDINLKGTVHPEYSYLSWKDGDKFHVWSDAGQTPTVVSYSVGRAPVAVVPAEAKQVLALFPVHEGEFDGQMPHIPSQQFQSAAGKPNPRYLGLHAEAAISKGKAVLDFECSALAWALNIYNSSLQEEEKVSSVTLTSAGTPLARVSLGEPYLPGASRPAADLAPESQIFICTDSGSYDDLSFEILTTLKTYAVPLASEGMPSGGGELMEICIDLSTGKAEWLLSEDSEVYIESDYPADPKSPMEMDFSRIGYHYGETDIPEYNDNVIYLEPDGTRDRTADIQNALDGVTQPGSVVLKAGQYYVSEKIYIRRDRVILRGETDAGSSSVSSRNLATIIGTKTDCADEKPRMIILGKNPGTFTEGGKVNIIGDHVPEGCMFVRVSNPEKFAVMDRILVCRPDNALWSHDLGMDNILSKDGMTTYSWNDYDYSLDIKAERTVLGIEGNKLILDNPLPMALDSRYGQAYVCKYDCSRVKESGVEDLNFDNLFDEAVKSTNYGLHAYTIPEYYSDENHFWDAVRVSFAEHCWVRRITARHFSFAAVSIYNKSKNISVLDCHSFEPVSEILSPRRYAFVIGGAQLCLIKDCTCEYDRHQFVTTGVESVGPHAFVNCSATNSFSNAGPHSHWASFVLYDNVSTDYELTVEDIQYAGYSTGAQGWQGANHVFWNCSAPVIVCQSPQVSAANWAWGCIGVKKYGSLDRTQAEGSRPDGQWYSLGSRVAPTSLYEYQLRERLEKGLSLQQLYQ